MTDEALLRLLERQMRLYTMGEHSSLPEETAEELVKSISFTIFCCQGEQGELTDGDPAVLLERGRAVLRREVSRGRMLLRAAERGMPPFAGRSYRETLSEIGGFFRAYDLRFFAHRVPCLIDYQLDQPVPGECQGIFFINEYLRRLSVENAFCARFDPLWADRALRQEDPLYREEVSNLYGPLAERALLLTLLDGDIPALTLTEREWETKLRAGESLAPAAARLARVLELTERQSAYLAGTARALEIRLGAER